MTTSVQAIFDIGKTNKKLFLFDQKGQIQWSTTTHFPTIEDEDGFPSDDLHAIETWVKTTIQQLAGDPKWDIQRINFSAYGASLVYLDKNGKRLPLFINYLKPYPEQISDSFFGKYGPTLKFCRESASPYLGMLNSGLQIYWLKYAKPQWFEKIRYVLHFPQYLSYLFTQTPLAEYTSIGCHTGMWDYESQDYHRWIDEEGIRPLLPPLKASNTTREVGFGSGTVQVGTGLHDTSASLIPYLASEKEPFLLLSTGTWAVCVNPFSTSILSEEDLQNDCLNFLGIEGQQVRAARLFLGREHEIQVNRLSEHYGVEVEKFMRLDWNEEDYAKSKSAGRFPFTLEHLNAESSTNSPSQAPSSWIHAYYQLMDILVPLQVAAVYRSAGGQNIRRLIIEGGFIHNKIYFHLLRRSLPDWEVSISTIRGGSARGVWELGTGKEGPGKQAVM